MDTLDTLKQAAAHLPDLRPHRLIDSTNPETGHTRYSMQFVYGHETYEKWFCTPFYDSLDQLVYDFVIVLEDTTMANIFKMSGDLFKYLTAEMMPDGKDATMTIKEVDVEELQNQRGKQERVVIHFKESGKGMVVGNKTNVRQLAALLGPETDDWIGKRITLYSTEIQAFGKTLRTIRVRDKLPKQNGTPTVSAPPPLPDELIIENAEPPTEPDELPFALVNVDDDEPNGPGWDGLEAHDNPEPPSDDIEVVIGAAEFAVQFAEYHPYFKDNFHVIGTLQKVMDDKNIGVTFNNYDVDELAQHLENYAESKADSESK